MNQSAIFKALTNKELREIYEDMVAAKRDGVRPRSLDRFIDIVKKSFQMSTVADAWKLTEELFYEEVAKRFFLGQTATSVPVFSGVSIETGEEIIGNALELDDGELRIATSCLVDSDDPDLITVAARRVKNNQIHQID